MTGIPMARIRQDRRTARATHTSPHLVIQILGLLLFGGFAIVSTVLAFVMFWPAGFALAIFLGWFGFGRIFGSRSSPELEDEAAPEMAQPAPDVTENSSFGAHRTAILQSLEEEQKSFIGFLDRLRDAKDKSEFDSFMEDRARANQAGVTAPTEAARPGEY